MKADLELRRLWVDQHGPFYELIGATASGQEFITDVLELRGTGSNKSKLYITGKDRTAFHVKLALDEGLSVMSVAAGAK